jgi:glucosamine-6-phosphate deaminase
MIIKLRRDKKGEPAAGGPAAGGPAAGDPAAGDPAAAVAAAVETVERDRGSAMTVIIYDGKDELGAAAAEKGAELINKSIAERGEASIILATGASQFATLAGLVAADGIDWPRVTAFHLDEYLGLPENHPASFRRYLKERFVEKVPSLAAFHFVEGDADDPEAECLRLDRLIAPRPVDVAFVGIGENGHLAFNDPPADFKTRKPFLVVALDEACRKQQLGEGWFASLQEVPDRAISMSVVQIMESRHLIVSVPDQRKARAVKAAVEGPVSPACPASILQTHGSCYLLLDKASGSGLEAL